MDVSKNSGTLKSSILIGFSKSNHPFLGTPIFGNIHIYTAHSQDLQDFPDDFRASKHEHSMRPRYLGVETAMGGIRMKNLVGGWTNPS